MDATASPEINDLRIPLLQQQQQSDHEDVEEQDNDNNNINDSTTSNHSHHHHHHIQQSSISVNRRRRRCSSCPWYYYFHCTLLPDQLPTSRSRTSTQPQEEEEQEEEDSILDRSRSTTGNGNNDDVNDDDDSVRINSNQNNSEATVATTTTDNDNMIIHDDETNNNEMISSMIKLMKFVSITLIGIFGLHYIVSFRTNHRDSFIKAWHIWVFQTNLIVRDCIVFFVVGRLWKKRGIDHIAWIAPMILCNIYFESQHYISFLRYSMTLYQMHCEWPWQLWIFIIVVIVPIVGCLVVLHIRYAITKRLLGIKFMEILITVSLFVIPSIVSYPKYFHFHHWFAGWLIGMHCNYDTWWSNATMAWCWGMYINGIAVYGRDPILTCQYAGFLIHDLRCPFGATTSAAVSSSSSTTTTTTTTCDNNGHVDLSSVPNPFSWSTHNSITATTSTNTGASLFMNDKIIWKGLISPLYDNKNDDGGDMPTPAVDWKNCSSKGYHP